MIFSNVKCAVMYPKSSLGIIFNNNLTPVPDGYELDGPGIKSR
jgi:hypothetical protein